MIGNHKRKQISSKKPNTELSKEQANTFYLLLGKLKKKKQHKSLSSNSGLLIEEDKENSI